MGRLGIKVGRGFIGKDQGGIRHQRPGDGHPLFLAPRDLVRVLLGLISHVHSRKQTGNPLCAFLGRYVLDHDQRIFDIFVNRKYGDQVEILKNEAEMLTPEGRAFLAFQPDDVCIGDAKVTRRWFVQATDEIEDGCLAAARRPDKRNEGGGFNFKVHVLQGVNNHVFRLVIFGDVLCFNQCHCAFLLSSTLPV